jgi:hypothetical protein
MACRMLGGALRGSGADINPAGRCRNAENCKNGCNRQYDGQRFCTEPLTAALIRSKILL